MLGTIPGEIITHIAYHLAVTDLLPPIALLRTCKHVHSAISPSDNPRLYSRLFHTAFDCSASQRRLGEVNAKQITAELEQRIRTIHRLGYMIRRQDLRGVTVGDLWVIYLLLIENDGKNVWHLISPSAILHLPTFLRLYHEQHLLTAALEPGYPAETHERALVMWIAWLLAGYDGGKHESQEDKDERMFVLRPYVFAPHQYDVSFAPWTISDLPISESSPVAHDINPFIADLQPKSRRIQVKHYGQTLAVAPPILSHAAILRFFSKHAGQRSSVDANQLAAPFAALGGGQPPAPAPAPAPVEVDSDDDDGDETFGAIRDLVSDSRNHDRDFDRLRSCYDPFSCRGMKRSAWRNTWTGCWEGTFSFFEFDAFREMLAGQSRALYEGSYGEQAQVWRLVETWVWRKEWAEKKAHERALAEEEREKARLEAGESGEKGKGKSRGLPLKGPVTNAGFPTDQPSSTSAGLASAAAEAITLKETIRQQVEAIEGYDVVPPDFLEEALNEPDGGEESGLEVILTGVGHSAWGRFILKGRVRSWDGMASLVKEYAPDSRGKWIYRGYVLSGDIFVGRWRDTFTPEEFVGYEGTFILNRRS